MAPNIAVARRLWIVVAAKPQSDQPGLALLALLGTSPDADILAHLFGLLLGGAMGMVTALALPLRPSTQWALAVAVLALVVGTWVRAVS
jgi:rhomboid protease GluP